MLHFRLAWQVGSKNAAFFMGQSVKVITKRVDSPYVHELGLVAAELEQRYKDSKVSLKASSTPLPPPHPPSGLSLPLLELSLPDGAKAAKASCSHSAAMVAG